MTHKAQELVYSYDQTPDDQIVDGNYVRPQCRYTGVSYMDYDSPQQDRFFLVRNAADVSERGLKTSFNSISSHFSDPDYAKSGTTASLAHISRNGILTIAHVADSPVSLYVYDPRARSMDFDTVTTAHTPDLEEERERIAQAGGVVALIKNHYYLAGKLALSRALGDTARTGITHTPDTRSIDLNPYFDKGMQVVITVESDGVIEKTGYTARADLIQRLLENNKAEDIAPSLVALADKNGSSDNITSQAIVLVAPPSTNIAMGVFDGHGKKGAAAAELAKSAFEQEMRIKL